MVVTFVKYLNKATAEDILEYLKLLLHYLSVLQLLSPYHFLFLLWLARKTNQELIIYFVD